MDVQGWKKLGFLEKVFRFLRVFKVLVYKDVRTKNTTQEEHYACYTLITGWAVAQTCCISQCAKYRKSGIFGYPWEQNP